MNREKWKKIGKSAINGKLLLALEFDKYLDRIVYIFVCALLFIWFNIVTDKTLHTKEENRKIIENLQSMHTDATCRLTALDSVCEVEKMLRDMGSDVQIPGKKAKRAR